MASGASRTSLWHNVPTGDSDDHWQVTDDNSTTILEVLNDLQLQVHQARSECIKKRWKYTRKSGETIIFRDVFEKMAKWVDLFKQVGDIAIQYDPVHTALPWAGVRFLLQIAVGDISTFAFVVEDAEMIAGLVARCAVLEQLYLHGTSATTMKLKDALSKLYKAIINYFSEAKRYFQQNSLKRIIKSAALGVDNFSQISKTIRTEDYNVQLYCSLVDAECTASNQAELKDILHAIDQPIMRMDKKLEAVEDFLERAERMRIQNWLSSQPYKFYHAETKKGIIPGTGQWLLGDPLFRKWKRDSVSSILWLHGIPGSGKSKLTAIVVEELLEGFRQGLNPPPAYFYCSRNPTEPGRSEPDAIIASIVRQLSGLQGSHAMLPPALKLYRDREEDGFASGPMSLDESIGMIVELSEYYSQLSIIIDALDECHSEKRGLLLDALEQILRMSFGMVKIFVSSRNDHDIVCHLQSYPDLCISSEKNKVDIVSFVEVETETLISRRKLLRYSSAGSELREVIKRSLCMGASGMFRWASLQLEYLCTLTTDEAILERLGQPPPKLTELYEDLYKRIYNFQSNDRQAAINTFKWLLCGRKPLKTSEFLSAISANTTGKFKGISKESVLNLCSNFVVVDAEQDVFRFAHLSVREYLETRSEYTTQLSNALAAESCLCYLINTSKESQQGRTWHETSASPVTESASRFMIPIIGTFFNYAVEFWPEHCQYAAELRQESHLQKILFQFLFDSPVSGGSSLFAYWMCMVRNSPERVLNLRLSNCLCSPATPVFVCCAYGFGEIVPIALQAAASTLENDMGRSRVEVAIFHGQLSIAQTLLEHGDSVTEADMLLAVGLMEIAPMNLLLNYSEKSIITAVVIETAMGNKWVGTTGISLLLSCLGRIDITAPIVWTLAGNTDSGRSIMKLLLSQDHIKTVPKEVVLSVVSNCCAGPAMTCLLLLRPEKLCITEDILMAAARNTQSGTEVISLLLSQLGTEILPEFVLTAGIGYWDAKALTTFLLGRGEEHPDLPIEVSQTSYQLLPSRRGPSAPTFSLPKTRSSQESSDAISHDTPSGAPQFPGSGQANEEAHNSSPSHTWMLVHGLDNILGVNDRVALAVARRHQQYIMSGIRCAHTDAQGIEWPVGVTRSYARQLRRETYENFKNVFPSVARAQSAEPEHILHSLEESKFFQHRNTASLPDLHVAHFQLRHLLVCPDNNELYYATEAGVGHLIVDGGSITTDPDVISILGYPEASYTSTLAADDNVVATGNFRGQCLIKSRKSEGLRPNFQRDLEQETKQIVNYAMLHNRKYARFATNNGSIHVLDYHTNTMLERQSYDFPINCFDLSPDARLQVCVGDTQDVLVHDIQTKEILYHLESHLDFGFSCAWSDNGWHVATGNQDKTVKIWDARMWTSRSAGTTKANPITTIHSEMSCVRSLKFSPTGGGKRVLLCAESADFVSIIDADTFTSRQIIDLFGEIGGLAISPDGQDVYVGISDFATGCIMRYSRA